MLLNERKPIDCKFVVDRQPDGQHTVTPVDIYADGEDSVLKNIPQIMKDEAEASVWAAVMNDPLWFLSAARWSQEEWDRVIGRVRTYLEEKSRNKETTA